MIDSLTEKQTIDDETLDINSVQIEKKMTINVISFFFEELDL